MIDFCCKYSFDLIHPMQNNPKFFCTKMYTFFEKGKKNPKFIFLCLDLKFRFYLIPNFWFHHHIVQHRYMRIWTSHAHTQIVTGLRSITHIHKCLPNGWHFSCVDEKKICKLVIFLRTTDDCFFIINFFVEFWKNHYKSK